VSAAAEWKSWPKVGEGKPANDKRYTGERVDGTRALGECWWCRRPATRLCDTLLRERLEDGNLDFYREATCDAVICDECTKARIVFFNMGDDLHSTDTIDRCPYCQEHAGQRRARRQKDAWRETDFVSAPLWRERVQKHAANSKPRGAR
jgi:hypothetical protein